MIPDSLPFFTPDSIDRILIAPENITNKDYRVLGSGLNEPGRNLVVGLDLAF